MLLRRMRVSANGAGHEDGIGIAEWMLTDYRPMEQLLHCTAHLCTHHPADSGPGSVIS